MSETAGINSTPSFVPHNLIITGGAGFIGSNFAHFVAHYHPTVKITVLDALTYAGNKRNLDGISPEQLSFVHGNICDEKLVDNLFSEADCCVHFAAESHNDNSIANPYPFLKTPLLCFNQRVSTV